MGLKSFDINARSIIAFREIGKGHTAMETLFGYLNCVPPMAYESYREMNKDIAICYSNITEKYKYDAVNELKSNVAESEDGIYDVAVSCDGTWQKRGYASLNGVVTLISVDTGKVLDHSMLTKKCSQCTAWESRKGTEAYEEFMSTHNDDCDINHVGSAGAMESAGIVECFGLSMEKYKLRYTEYLGDGDTKSYHDVVKSDPYNGREVKKLECIGHIQKRVGARLLKMRKNGDFKDLYDGDDEIENGKSKKRKRKALRLTDKDINKLQNYYGIAMRSSTGETIWQLKKAIAAAFYHCCDASSLEDRHQFCPKSELSWCKYQSDIVNGTTIYKNKPGVHVKLRKLLKPVFMNLSSDELLAKCLHGKTQNNNESLNGIIWKRCPKDVYVGRTTLGMGIYSAIIDFNVGAKGLLKVMDEYGLVEGDFCAIFVASRDMNRIKEMNRKSSDCAKHSRKKHRAIRKGFNDKEKEKEGVTYGPGMCELLADS